MKGYAIAASLALCCAGCARLEIKSVANDDKGDGVPFYEPRPYLMITSTATDSSGKVQNGFSTQIIWLPNMGKRHLANPVPGLGTADTSVKLVNGWMLDSVASKMDSKVPETISAVSGLMKEIGPTALIQTTNQQDQIDAIVGIYRIDINADTGALTFVKQKDWK